MKRTAIHIVSLLVASTGCDVEDADPEFRAQLEPQVLDSDPRPNLGADSGDHQNDLQVEPTAEPAPGPAADPVDSVVVPTQKSTYCERLCTTDTISGTGIKTVDSPICGIGTSDMTGGGCNVEDGYVDVAELLDNYPSSDTRWRCKVDKTTTASFDVQACCIQCDF